jgi:hypothetical protein
VHDEVCIVYDSADDVSARRSEVDDDVVCFEPGAGCVKLHGDTRRARQRRRRVAKRLAHTIRDSRCVHEYEAWQEST